MLRRLLSRLPEGPPAWLLAEALNLALAARLLDRAALEPLKWKTVRLELADLACGVQVTLGPYGFRASRAKRADVTIRAAARDYLALGLRREDPDTLFFTRRLAIEGDTELGLIVKNALDAVDWSRLPMARP